MEPLDYVAQDMIVVYRNRLDTAAAIVVGLIAAVGFVTVGLATLGAPAWFRVLLPVGGLLYGYLLVFRGGRVGVYKARGAIRVQDWFRRTTCCGQRFNDSNLNRGLTGEVIESLVSSFSKMDPGSGSRA